MALDKTPIIIVLVCTLIIIFLMGTLSHISSQIEIQDCKKYDALGYITKLEKINGSFLIEQPYEVCQVQTKTGAWIKLKDIVPVIDIESDLRRN